MKTPRITLDRLKNHFAYSWWAYLVSAVLLVFFWSWTYSATRYVPPRENSLHVYFAGKYVSDDFLEAFQALGEESFPELELFDVQTITIDMVNGDENTYYAQERLSVAIMVGESDIFMIDASQFEGYAMQGAFVPLDDLLEEGGLLHGYYSDEEIAQGTVETEDGESHVYGLPASRFYAYFPLGADPRGYVMCKSVMAGNAEATDKMLKIMTEHGMSEERPEWLDEYEKIEQKAQEEADALTPIG